MREKQKQIDMLRKEHKKDLDVRVYKDFKVFKDCFIFTVDDSSPTPTIVFSCISITEVIIPLVLS